LSFFHIDHSIFIDDVYLWIFLKMFSIRWLLSKPFKITFKKYILINSHTHYLKYNFVIESQWSYLMFQLFHLLNKIYFPFFLHLHFVIEIHFLCMIQLNIKHVFLHFFKKKCTLEIILIVIVFIFLKVWLSHLTLSFYSINPFLWP
jgi:hypothetical protein